MEIDKFINSFLIFLLFAILSSMLYLQFAMQTTAFQEIFNQTIKPRIEVLQDNVNATGEVLVKNCTKIPATSTELCLLKRLPTSNSTGFLSDVANSINLVGNIIINIVNVPLRVIFFILMVILLITNFITLLITLVITLPQFLLGFNILNFSWVGIILIFIGLMILVYVVWKILEYIHGLV
jgi:hypothetical protein